MKIKLLTTAEFAVAMGTTNGSISMAYKNGKLVRNAQKLYDINHEINQEWIWRQEQRSGKKFDMSRIIEWEKQKVSDREAKKAKRLRDKKKKLELENKRKLEERRNKKAKEEKERKKIVDKASKKTKQTYKDYKKKEKELERLKKDKAKENYKSKLELEHEKERLKQERKKQRDKQREEEKKISEKEKQIKEPIDLSEFDEQKKPREIRVREKIQAYKEERNLAYLEKKQQLELEEKEYKNQLSRLKIKKMEGSLIPYDEAGKVFLYASETFRTTYIQEVDAIANIYIKILGGDQEDFVDIKKKLMEKINDIQKTVKENIISGLKNIQNEYKEVRGRGERK